MGYAYLLSVSWSGPKPEVFTYDRSCVALSRDRSGHLFASSAARTIAPPMTVFGGAAGADLRSDSPSRRGRLWRRMARSGEWRFLVAKDMFSQFRVLRWFCIDTQGLGLHLRLWQLLKILDRCFEHKGLWWADFVRAPAASSGQP